MFYTARASSLYSRVKILVLVLAIPQRNPSAYNINSLDAKIFRDPVHVPGERPSYFGFSVALYVGANESLLLVGAPRANSDALPFVREPGTVFKCAINNGTCKEWVIDRTGNGPHPREKLINQIKDNAWIGATIAVQNSTDAKVTVCGPRWVNNIIHDNKPNWYMNGICYMTLARNANAFERPAEEHFLPISDSGDQIAIKNNINIYNYGVAQVGFSLHMNSRYTVNVAMGTPGVYNWKGGAIKTVDSMDGSFSRTIIPSIAKEQRIHSYNYFGYAITAGTYFNEQDVWYASSAPQAANMFGKVLIFIFPPRTNEPIFIKETMLYGQHYGEYFGAALTSCDVNNDRRQELIVGAPQWSRDMDEGRVYIFTVRYNNNLEELQTIEGEIVGGRFGSSVMCLGDIDHDGYGDIAVGAPYEEESGGAVYIFNGNRDGISRKYSQRLVGSRFSPTIRGFGISISEPRDVNLDNYSDVAVGAYLSGEAVLLRSVPVVTVNVTLMYLQKIKLLRNTTTFKIDVWMSYDGTYVPEYLQVTAILKIDPMYGRATYPAQKSDDGLQTYRLRYTLFKATITSNLLEIHLKENIENIIDPLEISMSMQLEDDLHARNESSSCASCVVINKLRSKTEDLIKLPFSVDCGEDNVCVSNLGITLSTDSPLDNRYIIGSTPIITLRVDVYNRGEPAYQTRVRIFTEVLTLASLPPKCTEDPRTSTLDVTCDIGNPLRTNKTLILQLDMRMVRYDVREVEIRANITTQSDDANWNDNSYTITVHFDVDIDIAIAGKAQEYLYSYLPEDEKESLNDIRFQHYYEVQKFGASPIEEVMLTVKIPTHLRRHNAEDVAVVSINDTIGRMDGYQFYCSDSNQTEVMSIASNKITSTDDVIVMTSSSLTSNSTHAKFSIEEDTPINVPSENRTLYINCTSNAIKCVKITCRLGPFLSSQSVAKFLVTLDLQLSSFSADMLKHKDIIFYVTEGSVTITQPDNVAQREGHKPDVTLVATTFLGSPIAQRIAIWIIALSVVLGVLLLLLLVLGLIKLGFFNRKKKLELEALKAETDTKCNVVPETTSSTEALDHD